MTNAMRLLQVRLATSRVQRRTTWRVNERRHVADRRRRRVWRRRDPERVRQRLRLVLRPDLRIAYAHRVRDVTCVGRRSGRRDGVAAEDRRHRPVVGVCLQLLIPLHWPPHSAHDVTPTHRHPQHGCHADDLRRELRRERCRRQRDDRWRQRDRHDCDRWHCCVRSGRRRRGQSAGVADRAAGRSRRRHRHHCQPRWVQYSIVYLQ